MADTEEKVADKPEIKDEVKAEVNSKKEGAAAPVTNGDKKEEAPKEVVQEEKPDEKATSEPAKDNVKPDEKDKPEKNEEKETEEKAEEESKPKEDDTKAAKEEEKAKKADDKTEEMDVDEEEDKKRKQSDDETPQDGKRRRKSAAVYVPEDFSEKHSNLRLFEGRGDKLKDIPGSKDSIMSYLANSKEVEQAYRFLFFTRGRVPIAKAKEHLLDFSGYLPEIKDDEDKAKREKEDEETEKKMSQRAYKMSLPAVKSLCDFFDVDRTPGPDEKVNKDLLIDRLLDFLSGPNESLTRGVDGAKRKPASRGTPKSSAKKKAAAASPSSTKKPTKRGPKKKKSYKEESDSEVSEPEASEGSDNEDEPAPGDLPDDEELRMWVKAYVACHNMNKVTLNHALKLAKSKFGVSMKSKKKTMKQFLTEEC